MSPSRPKPEPEVIPPGQSHGSKDSAGKKRASGPGFEATIDDLGERLSSLMNHPMAMPRLVYGLYALSVVSGFPLLIGLVVALLARKEAPEWLQSHYTFLIRTFLYLLILMAIGFVLAFALVGFMLLWILPFWLAVRVVRGWFLLQDHKPVPDPESWFFG
jgi:uncharacterized membrane protein